MMPKDSDNEIVQEPKLKHCNLSECEARCCYDGVYLMNGEEEMIDRALKQDPELFLQVGPDPIVDGCWMGRVTGRKTSVRPYDFKHPEFPAHFTRTRCVFCDPEHKCLLQVFSQRHTNHPWTYKPTACWIFPLRIENGEPTPPPTLLESDPYDLGPEYPGYSKFVPCGQEQPDGKPWTEVLKGEIERFEACASLPFLPTDSVRPE